jgi:hypothetical protein
VELLSGHLSYLLRFARKLVTTFGCQSNASLTTGARLDYLKVARSVRGPTRKQRHSKGLLAASSRSTSLPGTHKEPRNPRDVISVVREEFPGHSSSALSAGSGTTTLR